MIKVERAVLALVLALQVGCIQAVQQNTFPKWTAYLMLVGTVMQAFMASVMGQKTGKTVPPPPPEAKP